MQIVTNCPHEQCTKTRTIKIRIGKATGNQDLGDIDLNKKLGGDNVVKDRCGSHVQRLAKGAQYIADKAEDVYKYGADGVKMLPGGSQKNEIREKPNKQPEPTTTYEPYDY